MTRMLILATLVLSGCKGIPAEVQIRAGTTIATGATLYALKADAATVGKVRAIGITVRDAVQPGGTVDLELVQREVAKQIGAAFPKAEQAQAITNLINYSAGLVLAYLQQRGEAVPPSVLYLYIHEAAAGVVDGCSLYSPVPMALGPESVYLAEAVP